MAIKKSAKKASSKAAPKTMKISLVKGYTQADVIKKITPAFIKKLHDAPLHLLLLAEERRAAPEQRCWPGASMR